MIGRRSIAACLAIALATGSTVMLVGCGMKAATSGGIVLDEAERDERGYLSEAEVTQAALRMANVLDEAECTLLEAELDEDTTPARWVVDFDADGVSYRYVVDAKNGDLIDFSQLSL